MILDSALTKEVFHNLSLFLKDDISLNSFYQNDKCNNKYEDMKYLLIVYHKLSEYFAEGL